METRKRMPRRAFAALDAQSPGELQDSIAMGQAYEPPDLKPPLEHSLAARKTPVGQAHKGQGALPGGAPIERAPADLHADVVPARITSDQHKVQFAARAPVGRRIGGQ